MQDFTPRNPYIDYRNNIPFIDLTGYIDNQPKVTDQIPAKSLQEHLLRKRLSTMINLRRLQYRKRVEDYKNGRI